MNSDWNRFTLDEVCLKITDGAHQSPKSVDRGKPMCSVKDLTEFGLNLGTARHISNDDFDNLVRQGCMPLVGDVLIAKDGNSALNTVCSIDEPVNTVLLSSVAILRPDPQKLNTDFLKYYLKSKKTIDYLKTNFISGAAIPRIVLRDFRKAEITLPDISKQRSISKKLRSLDDKIQLNHQINQTLEQIAQALFKSWFVDFDPVKAKIDVLEAGGSEEEALIAAMQVISSKNAEELAVFEVEKPKEYAQLRATAELFPAAMVESELGGIPEGWEAGEIGDVTSVRGGYAFKGKDFVTTGNPVIKIKNITSTGTVSTLGCDCIDDELAKPASRFKLSDGDILMAMTGATVGKSGIYVSDGRDGYLNQRVAKFESNIESSMPCWFTYNLINRGNVFEQIVGAAQGSAQPNISAKGIEQVKTIIPCIPLIKQYQKLVTPLYGQWIANFKESRQLSELRDTLLPKLLSGEINAQ